MKDDESMINRGMQGFWKKVLSGKKTSLLKKRWVGFLRKKPLEKAQEERLLEQIRDLHWLTIEKAKMRAPHILNGIRFEEITKESRTRQESMILATSMITCLLNELNRIADISPQEADDFIEKAKSSLDIIASSRMRSRRP
jgi:hypothetical protein